MRTYGVSPAPTDKDASGIPLLQIEGLSKNFGTRKILALDNLKIEQGAAYALTGINGCGKSTLLRILAGLERAKIHHARWQGEPIFFAPYPQTIRRAVVYVHQHPVLFSGSVMHNVGYGLRARGLPRDVIEHEVNMTMRWAGIEHLRLSAIHSLSGGEVQRVALARAKVLRPQLLLLDEPTSNLDGAAREMVIALVATLITEGRSIVMACHDRDLISLPNVQRLKLRDAQLEVRLPKNHHLENNCAPNFEEN